MVSPSLPADHLLDLRSNIGAANADYLPALIAADTVGGWLVALPYSLNFGLLFYRRDLLARSAMPVSDTWDRLERAAAVVEDQERNAGNARFRLPVAGRARGDPDLQRAGMDRELGGWDHRGGRRPRHHR